MAPKSSEADTKSEEASKEREMTESMEVEDSSVKKRKAEETADDSGGEIIGEEDDGDETADSDEEDGGDGGTERTDYSSPDSVPEWGVDSFDGLDYESPEKYMDMSDEEAEADFEWRRYLRQVYRSKGFEVDFENVPKRLFHGYRPIDLDVYFHPPNLTGRQYMEDMVSLALDKYNQQQGLDVKCDHVIRAVVRMAEGIVAYITFMAREMPGADLIEYQAKTEWKVWNRNTYPIFCRPAPKPNDEKIDVEDQKNGIQPGVTQVFNPDLKSH